MVGGTQVDLDVDAGPRLGVRQGQRHPRAARSSPAICARCRRSSSRRRASGWRRSSRSSSLAQTKATITFDEGYPPLAPTDGNRKLLAIYDQASRDVGAGPVAAVDPDRAGAADVSFVAGARADDPRRHRPDGRRRAHRQRNRRSQRAAVTDQARGAAVVSAVAVGQSARRAAATGSAATGSAATGSDPGLTLV